MANSAQHRRRSLNVGFRTVPAALTAAIVLALIAVLVPAAQAETFKVIYNFTDGADGGNPYSGLAIDRSGNLYGTTQRGNGTVFKLAHAGSGWILTVLYSFQGGNDGAAPYQVTFGPDGSLYGTTIYGGGSGCGGSGCGTVYRLSPPPTACKAALCPWTETVLYRFEGGTDGAHPSGAIIFDQSGSLYGTTIYGGSFDCEGFGCGTDYQLTPSNGGWSETILYRFAGKPDGVYPTAGPIFDQAGNLYGTTSGGGGGNGGTVYELTHSGSSWTEAILYDFPTGSDGSMPEGGLVFDSSGNLFGTTELGNYDENGTVFELTPANGSWIYTLVYVFSGNGGGPHDTLILDQAGNLYGTTFTGGSNDAGAVFRMTFTEGMWLYSSLHDFTGGNDGGYPTASLVFGSNGNLYSTTYLGGTGICGANGCGVVFEILP